MNMAGDDESQTVKSVMSTGESSMAHAASYQPPQENASNEGSVQAQKQKQQATAQPAAQPAVDPTQPDAEDADQIGIDATNQRVACVIQLALIFFCVLIVVVVVMVFTIVQQYGLLALGFTFVVVMAVAGLAYFLDKVMKEDRKWKPIRRKIQYWQAVTKAVIVKELRDFQLDWNEYLLLTDGKAVYDVYEEEDIKLAGKPKQKHRSALFRMVKPLLRIRNLGRRKKSMPESSPYMPPVV
jgi:cation transport ATPase